MTFVCIYSILTVSEADSCITVTTKSRSTGRGLGEIGNGAKDVGTSVPAASSNGLASSSAEAREIEGLWNS